MKMDVKTTTRKLHNNSVNASNILYSKILQSVLRKLKPGLMKLLITLFTYDVIFFCTNSLNSWSYLGQSANTNSFKQRQFQEDFFRPRALLFSWL